MKGQSKETVIGILMVRKKRNKHHTVYLNAEWMTEMYIDHVIIGIGRGERFLGESIKNPLMFERES